MTVLIIIAVLAVGGYLWAAAMESPDAFVRDFMILCAFGVIAYAWSPLLR